MKNMIMKKAALKRVVDEPEYKWVLLTSQLTPSK